MLVGEGRGERQCMREGRGGKVLVMMGTSFGAVSRGFHGKTNESVIK